MMENLAPILSDDNTQGTTMNSMYSCTLSILILFKWIDIHLSNLSAFEWKVISLVIIKYFSSFSGMVVVRSKPFFDSISAGVHSDSNSTGILSKIATYRSIFREGVGLLRCTSRFSSYRLTSPIVMRICGLHYTSFNFSSL